MATNEVENRVGLPGQAPLWHQPPQDTATCKAPARAWAPAPSPAHPALAPAQPCSSRKAQRSCRWKPGPQDKAPYRITQQMSSAAETGHNGQLEPSDGSVPGARTKLPPRHLTESLCHRETPLLPSPVLQMGKLQHRQTQGLRPGRTRSGLEEGQLREASRGLQEHTGARTPRHHQTPLSTVPACRPPAAGHTQASNTLSPSQRRPHTLCGRRTHRNAYKMLPKRQGPL